MVKREWVEEHVERQRGVTGVLTHLHMRSEANQLLLQFAALWLSRVLAQQIHQTQIPCFNVVLSATGRDRATGGGFMMLPQNHSFAFS